MQVKIQETVTVQPATPPFDHDHVLPLSHLDTDRNLHVTFRYLRVYAANDNHPAEPFHVITAALSTALTFRETPSVRPACNTRVVNQIELEFFREDLQNRLSSNYNVLLKERKTPMSLLNDHQKQARVHLLDTEPFADAFGPKTKRKQPKLVAFDYESLLKSADGSQACNTRVVNQIELEFFREELQNRLSSNYNVLLKERKTPMSLLNDHQKQARVHLLDTEPFADAFGPKTKRKQPKLVAFDYESLLKSADGSQGLQGCTNSWRD
ncbi:unnamed protein product [Fraxinus pennsylvanica]|uniref:Nucleolar GTP-binding protein 2 N-terminal domain-containing protein n=1 Tax=Fraxinus pennsylvanica TaxID=56036 RepID=A0AAD2DZF9_9LAMI|nr:unnamed protein product [Fraxinus pennsylvanica]